MQNSRASCFIPQGGDSILTAGTDGQLLATLGSVADSDNPAASQRCTNAGGVASVDKRSAQLGLHCALAVDAKAILRRDWGEKSRYTSPSMRSTVVVNAQRETAVL